MKHVKPLPVLGVLLIGTMTAGASDALAQGGIPDCSTMPNPVFMGGTTAVLPVIRHFGAKLRTLGSAGVTLLWNENSEGCSSVAQLVQPVSNKMRTVFSYYTENDPNDPKTKVYSLTCNGVLDQVPDLVINDTYWTSCQLATGGVANAVPTPLPSNFKEFLGPVQGLVPIVAESYLYYDAITAEELDDLYTCGAAGNILTFSNSSTIYDYNCLSSGMRELWARGLGFPGGQALTTQIGQGCNNSITAESMVTPIVAATTTPDTTIGYTSTEFYDENRDKVRALKVRGVNQLLAYLPDTDLTRTDKINLREGRYTIQGALKLVTQVDTNGVPVNPGVKKVIDWMQDNPLSDPTLTLPFDLNQVYAQHGVVPQCAMRVTKDSDALEFRHYRHPMPCHCSFEMLATGKACIPGCTACTDSSTCPTGKICSHGYCE